jgi:hypothetical protein
MTTLSNPLLSGAIGGRVYLIPSFSGGHREPGLFPTGYSLCVAHAAAESCVYFWSKARDSVGYSKKDWNRLQELLNQH